MRWKKNWYLAHRWLALVVSVQLLAWSVGGLVFSLLDIDDVRGELERSNAGPPRLRTDRVHVSVVEAIDVAGMHGVSTEAVCRVGLQERFGRSIYELFDAEGQALASVDAETGEVMGAITEEQAKSAALADFAPQATVASIALLEGEPPLEFRGGPMPVYQVILDHPKEPHLYVSPTTGEVLKRRNWSWRVFDFFWMLHIMDYSGRENFNHWLLTMMSVLAILTSASGVVLWWWRIPWWRRGGRSTGGQAASGTPAS